VAQPSIRPANAFFGLMFQPSNIAAVRSAVKDDGAFPVCGFIRDTPRRAYQTAQSHIHVFSILDADTVARAATGGDPSAAGATPADLSRPHLSARTCRC
jgi:hypothetical protein